MWTCPPTPGRSAAATRTWRSEDDGWRTTWSRPIGRGRAPRRTGGRRRTWGDRVRLRAARHRPDADHRRASSCCCSSSTRCGHQHLRRPRTGAGADRTARSEWQQRHRRPAAAAARPGGADAARRQRHRQPLHPAARPRLRATRSCRARHQTPTSRRARAHYTGTALPGQVGNFAIAGHRVGKGEPFLNLDQLRAGDAVIVETEVVLVRLPGQGRHRPGRHVDATPTPTAVPGREIVDPSDGNVLLPGARPPGRRRRPRRLMTMTTCHPKFTADAADDRARGAGRRRSPRARR